MGTTENRFFSETREETKQKNFEKRYKH